MMRVFLDSSVFLAACISPTGASREILRYAIRGKIELVINQIVLVEVERNLALKQPKAKPFFDLIKSSVPLEIIDPTIEEVQEMLPHTAAKDAPHLATAKRLVSSAS